MGQLCSKHEKSTLAGALLADMEPVMGLNRHTNYSVSISPGSYEWTANFYVEIGGSDLTRTSAGFYSPDVSGGSDYFTVSNPKLDTQKKQLTWTVKVNSGIHFLQARRKWQ